MFSNNETAEEWFERQHWGDAPRCPACESERVSKSKASVSKKTKRKRGRPETRVVKIDATSEYVAKAIFAAGKPNKK